MEKDLVIVMAVIIVLVVLYILTKIGEEECEEDFAEDNEE